MVFPTFVLLYGNCCNEIRYKLCMYHWCHYPPSGPHFIFIEILTIYRVFRLGGLLIQNLMNIRRSLVYEDDFDVGITVSPLLASYLNSAFPQKRKWNIALHHYHQSSLRTHDSISNTNNNPPNQIDYEKCFLFGLKRTNDEEMTTF